MRTATVLLGIWFLGGPGVVAAAGLQHQASSAADTGWTLDQPLTGRALSCEKGRIKILDCQQVELLSYLPESALGGAGEFDIWGWTDSTTGREFAVVGGSDGTAFVDVTDPVNPKYLGKLPFHGDKRGTAGVKVYKNYAFIVVEGAKAGLQIFDLTELRKVTAPQTFHETAHYDNFANAHTITLNVETGFAYPTGVAAGGETCGGGLHMIDVRTPTKPTFAGCYAGAKVEKPSGNGGVAIQGGSGMTDSYIHDAQCVLYHGPDKQYQGHEICLASTILAGAVDIVDVTDKQHPKRISAATYPGAGLPHQGWLTEDHRYFFLDDEGDEIFKLVPKTRTLVFDLTDLGDPVVLTEYFGTTTATDHNLYIRGRYMYQSNYAAGLRIVDIADPKHPQEVGYLDTAPDQPDGPGMNLGSWGNYPYFKNGVVAVASKGLFLVRLKQ